MTALTAALAIVSVPRGSRFPGGVAKVVAEGVSTLFADARVLAAGAFADRPNRIAWFCVAVPWILVVAGQVLAPPAAWDALTYHLAFPLHWIQSGHLDTIVQPTGERPPATPFYPLVAEMHYYWAFLSTGNDAWNGLAQAPFLAAASLAIACIAHMLGGSRSGAVLTAAVWASLPIAIRQSAEPMVDLVQVAFFLAAVCLLLRWTAEGGSWRWVLAGAALGLTAGVKYTGLLWASSLLPLMVAGLSTRRNEIRQAVPAIAGIALALGLGGYSYLRNLWAGGNPLLPIGLTLSGRTVLPGAREVASYFGTGLHRSVFAALLGSPRVWLELGLGAPLCVVGVVGAVARLLPLRRPPGPRAWAVPLAVILGLALYLFAIPYQDPRHLLVPASLAIAMIPGILPMGLPGRSASWLAGLLPGLNVPFTLFYWAKDRAASGPDARLALGIVAVLATVILWWMWGRRARGPLPRAAAGRRRLAPARALVLAAAAATLLACGVLPAYESSRFALWERYWSTRRPWGAPEARPELGGAAQAWTFLAERTRPAPATIAYAGTNIPYPLAGYGLENRIRFVPRNANREAWHFDWRTPVPEPFRAESVTAWLGNLTALGARYLCVLRELSDNDPAERFPIEASWADSHPEELRLVWASPWARIYEVNRP